MYQEAVGLPLFKQGILYYYLLRISTPHASLQTYFSIFSQPGSVCSYVLLATNQTLMQTSLCCVQLALQAIKKHTYFQFCFLISSPLCREYDIKPCELDYRKYT